MFDRLVRSRSSAARRLAPALLAGGALLLASPVFAQLAPTVSVGAGMRTSFLVDMPKDDDSVARFNLDSARLYFGGSVTETIKFMFNTEYNSGGNDVEILDAVAQMAFSPKFNVWFGRFLPPSDRANLYGPYYAHHWAVYTDGVQDGYPFIFQGRANGAMYWGQFDKVKLSGGVFDGPSLTGDTTPLVAGRAQVDFWDKEDGYYLNGTYYGAKNLLALGVAAQNQGEDKTAFNVDFLLEKKVGSGGAVSLEAQWNKYDGLGGYDPNYSKSDGGYLLAAYLFPPMNSKNQNRFEILGKFAKANFSEGFTAINSDYDQTTTELNLNYLIKEFNARIQIFFKNTDFSAVKQSGNQFGVGMQIQM